MKDTMIFTRMSEDSVELIRDISESRGESISNFVRRSVRKELARMSYLDDDDKKALEVSPN